MTNIDQHFRDLWAQKTSRVSLILSHPDLDFIMAHVRYAIAQRFCADLSPEAQSVCPTYAAVMEDRHVDVCLLKPQQQTISIDQVREAIDAVMHYAHQGKGKVIVICQAECMTSSAYNCLLKTLEEPLEQVDIILAVTQSYHLPATIISRCLQVNLQDATATEVPAQDVRDLMTGGVSSLAARLGSADSEHFYAVVRCLLVRSAAEKAEHYTQVLNTASASTFLKTWWVLIYVLLNRRLATQHPRWGSVEQLLAMEPESTAVLHRINEVGLRKFYQYFKSQVLSYQVMHLNEKSLLENLYLKWVQEVLPQEDLSYE